ncbi:MAG: CRTAC1 family protein [Caldilineaceae bacterium]|nr:CRTAC1 family protein [Caldilineaceae bacterium]
MRTFLPAILVSALLLCACSAGFGFDKLQGSTSYSALSDSLSITVNPLNLRTASTAQSGAQSRPCTGGFVEHKLPHVTGTAFERVTYFTSNGAGLAVGDLDNDGDEDFVLANLLGPNQIFWNEGNWQFHPQLLLDGSLRGLALVDVDGDGWLDITATSRSGTLLYWHNQGAEDNTAPFTDEQEPVRLRGVTGLAYSLQWGDLDRDGDLDLVTASYDASLEKQMGRRALDATDQNGVFIYENGNGRFLPTRLASRAQGLALQLQDLNGDRRIDILVGNDFDVHDAVFLGQRDGSWLAAEPFSTTTFSTMSFDSGDIDNDGQLELFAADMHPYSEDPEIMRQWLPVMETMPPPSPDDAPQVMANVLQEWQGDDWSDQAEAWRIPFSGWSWSAQFGDINQDGLLDLYVVNGMTAMEIFRHLPGDELVEENQAYRNVGGSRFTPAPEWKLNSTAGGRSMSMADFDGDGDLDVLINNLRSPSQMFENRLCSGQSLLVDLRQPDSGNTRALGAELLLHTSTGIYRRSVHAAGGYLSGRSARQHFGMPLESRIIALEVRWPDRALSLIDGRALQPGSLLTITRRAAQTD